MNKHEQRRKICDSWYHQKWFRIILIIVGLDMIFLGFAFVFNMDIVGILTMIPGWLRILGGILYVLCASFMVHYALSYNLIKRNTRFICQHCGHETIESNTINGE